MSQYADPLDFVKEVRRLAGRVRNLERRRPTVPLAVSDTAALTPTTANVSSINTAQFVKQSGTVWLYFNVTLATTLSGAATSLFTIADSRFLPNDFAAAYAAQPATIGAGWFGRITATGECFVYSTYGTYSSGTSLNGVAAFPARSI